VTGAGTAPDGVGRLVRYVLSARLAVAGLALVAVQTDDRSPGTVVTLVLIGSIGLNYLALQLWSQRPDRGGTGLGLVLGDVAVALALTAVVGAGSPMVLQLIAVAGLAGLTVRAAAALVVGLVVTAGYALLLGTGGGYLPGSLDLHTTITLPALLLGAAAAGVALRRLLVQQERSADQLWRLRRAGALRQERLRVARDLHDGLTKNLHGIWLLSRTLQAALDRADPDTAREAAAVIGTTAQGLAGQSRTVIAGLREPDVEPGPLVEALRARVDQARVDQAWAGQRVSVQLRDLRPAVGRIRPGPTAAGRSTLLAVAAESLHNIVKHAGAEQVLITLAIENGELTMEITDDGTGFEAARASTDGSGHYGLVGMSERATRSGGRLEVDSAPGEGCTVRLCLPLRAGRRGTGWVTTHPPQPEPIEARQGGTGWPG